MSPKRGKMRPKSAPYKKNVKKVGLENIIYGSIICFRTSMNQNLLRLNLKKLLKKKNKKLLMLASNISILIIGGMMKKKTFMVI